MRLAGEKLAESGIAMLPNGEIGPSQGPNTPIKMYDGKYMPDGTQPSGYRPGPTAEYPADEMHAAYNGGEIAMHPLLLPAHVIRGAVNGQPTADGTLPELRGQPDPFQQNNKIRPSDSDDQYMDIMKSGFV